MCANECYYGCICNGGNNNFVNCDFSSNMVALLIDNSKNQSKNNTHGTFSACSFNHSDSNNGAAIRILGTRNGEIFTGCQIFYGKIEIENSTGIRFDAINMGRQTPIVVKDSSAIVFSNCNMYNREESPLTQSGNVSLCFEDCYQRDGSIFLNGDVGF